MNLNSALPPEGVSTRNRVQKPHEGDVRRWIETTHERQARVKLDRLNHLIGAEFKEAHRCPVDMSGP
ncbi:MAG: hypothetical protein P8L16_07975 [Ilumatobacter sp.]|nr:hypothetical protein [Ilumatobacter sp.]